MVTLTKAAFIKVEALRMLKEAKDSRGEKFAGLFRTCVDLWAKRFELQTESWITFVDENPHSFRKDGETDDIDSQIEQNILDTYALGMTLQDAEIQEALSIGLSMDIKNDDAIQWAKTRVGELIKWVDETTQKEIQAIIEDAVTNGKTVAEIKQAIYEKFLQYTEYRANLIAVMELGNAFEQGKKAQFQRYTEHFGVGGYKRSYSQGDSNVRETHRQNAEAGWIPAQNLFPGTLTDTAPHGFNCRCTVSYSLWNPDNAKPSFM